MELLQISLLPIFPCRTIGSPRNWVRQRQSRRIPSPFSLTKSSSTRKKDIHEAPLTINFGQPSYQIGTNPYSIMPPIQYTKPVQSCMPAVFAAVPIKLPKSALELPTPTSKSSVSLVLNPALQHAGTVAPSQLSSTLFPGIII
jgi:hypothetical protein